jgi:hypothetical protein
MCIVDLLVELHLPVTRNVVQGDEIGVVLVQVKFSCLSLRKELSMQLDILTQSPPVAVEIG